jgi:uncharacterized protein (TIGR03000 family)
MLRPVWKKCLLLAALMMAGLVLSANPAQAGWWHWRTGCYGGYSWGCYPQYVYTTSYCSPCVTGCGWTWYRPAWSCGSCTGWYSGCYSPCYSRCCGTCCGVVSSCCDEVVVESNDGGELAPMPAAPAAEEPAVEMPPAVEAPAAEEAAEPSEQELQEPASLLPSPPAPKAVPPAPDVDLPRLPDMPPLPPAPGDASKPSAHRDVPADAALLTVVVPQDAQVYVNGMLTRTTGVERQYVSYGLQPGYSYTYEVRAVVTRNGRQESDTQVVRIRLGDARNLAFDFSAGAGEVIAARLR